MKKLNITKIKKEMGNKIDLSIIKTAMLFFLGYMIVLFIMMNIYYY